MENKVKKRITNSCGGRGCRIYILPKDKNLLVSYSKYMINKYLK